MNDPARDCAYSPAAEERVTALAPACAVKMENVTKRFGKVVANNAINLELREGEILSDFATVIAVEDQGAIKG